MLRPGNAGSNTLSDRLVVTDEAISQLPEEVAAGHHEGHDRSLVRREIVMRADSAGCTEDYLAKLRARNIGFSVVCRKNIQVQAAIRDAIGMEECWAPAVCQDGELREGAAVIELTSLVELSQYPAGTRLIVPREPPHPGGQQSLFSSLEFRYWGFYTDQAGDPVALDVFMRATSRRTSTCGRSPIEAPTRQGVKRSGIERRGSTRKYVGGGAQNRTGVEGFAG